MGYDLHITREPVEGWETWSSASTPAHLLQQLSDAKSKGDYDLVFDIEAQVEILLAPKKQAAGLLISEEEWIAAVESTPGARVANENPSWTNPRTGDVLAIINSEKSVEVSDPSGTWHMGICFREGRITFSGRAWEAAELIAIVACQLAAKLGAKIIGDEGEYYQFRSSNTATELKHSINTG